MSTDEEIREIFEQDIAEKDRVVQGKYGMLPYLDGMDGLSIQELLWGIVDEEDREMLQRILDGDEDGEFVG